MYPPKLFDHSHLSRGCSFRTILVTIAQIKTLFFLKTGPPSLGLLGCSFASTKTLCMFLSAQRHLYRVTARIQLNLDTNPQASVIRHHATPLAVLCQISPKKMNCRSGSQKLKAPQPIS